jgi:hypothetical protein
MRTLIIILATLMLTGCGQRYSGRGWPAEVDPYVQLYFELSRLNPSVHVAQGDYLTVEFGDLSARGPSVVGFCETRNDEGLVTLNPQFWASADENVREVLVLHELGHCLSFMEHRGLILSNGMASSIMYPYLVPTYMYGPNRLYFQYELFHTQPTITSADHGCTLTSDQLQ